MYFDSRRRIVLVLLEAEEGTPLTRIETECGIVVSPASPAEVIVYHEDSPLKVVFEAAYGSLPDGTIVVGVKDADGAFVAGDPAPKVKLILDPYQVSDDPEVIKPDLIAWAGGCPICGTLTDADLEWDGDEDEDDEDDDDDEGEDTGEDWTPGEGGDDEEEPAVIPMPRRFTLEMLNPSVN